MKRRWDGESFTWRGWRAEKWGLGWRMEGMSLPVSLDRRSFLKGSMPLILSAAVLGRAGLLRTHEVPKVRAVVDTLQSLSPGDIATAG